MATKERTQKPSKPPENQPRRARETGLGQADLARLLGCTPETIRNWTLDGCPRRDDGTYIVAEVFTWVRKWDRDRAAKEKPPKQQKEFDRKLSFEADLKELQLKRELGEVLPAAEYHASIAKIAGGFAAVAKGRLSRFEREVVKTTTPAGARRLMDKMSAALMEGAQGLADELEEEAAEDETKAAKEDAA